MLLLKWLISIFIIILKNPNVKQMLDCLRLQNALSKGFVITISRIADGLRLSKQTFKNGITEQPPKGLLKFLEDLVFIQTKMNCLIVVPLRDITDEDIKATSRLKQILTKGKIEFTWNSLHVDFYKYGAKDILDKLKNSHNQSISLKLENKETIQIFDTEIDVGTVIDFIEQATPVINLEELECLINDASQENIIGIDFKPGDSNKWVKLYSKWQNENS